MPDLTTPQLQSIQQLITDPLRETVRAEMRAGHERLAAAIEKVADHLATHAQAALNADRARASRADELDRRLATLERFRARVLVVYAALTIVSSLAWSLLHDYLATALPHH